MQSTASGQTKQGLAKERGFIVYFRGFQLGPFWKGNIATRVGKEEKLCTSIIIIHINIVCGYYYSAKQLIVH